MVNNKKLRLGLTSGIMVVVFLAVIVFGNILIEKTKISWDMSQEGVYSVSEQTQNILKSLDKDVTVYIVSSEEDFPIGYKQIVNQYTRYSKHVDIQYKDLGLYPDFASKTMGKSAMNVEANSMIVVSGDNKYYLDANEYVVTSYDENYSSTSAVQIESMLTSAINYVNDGEVHKVYHTVGHDELELLSSTQNGLLKDNYIVEEFTGLSNDIPEDADVILINAPANDFSKEECSKIKDYIDAGGNVYYIVEATADTPNLDSLMAEFGIQIEEGIVLEQDTSMIYGDTPTYLIPKLEDTPITAKMNQSRLAVLFFVSRGLTEKNVSDCTLTGLVQTSNYAYSKIDLDSYYVSREDSDIMGPFYLAMLSEKTDGGKLMVFASSNVLNDDVDELVAGNNTNLFLNSVNYMLGDDAKMSIRNVEIRNEYNMYTTAQFRVIVVVSIIGIPLALILVGIIIVILRRKRSQNYNIQLKENEK